MAVSVRLLISGTLVLHLSPLKYTRRSFPVRNPITKIQPTNGPFSSREGTVTIAVVFGSGRIQRQVPFLKKYPHLRNPLFLSLYFSSLQNHVECSASGPGKESSVLHAADDLTICDGGSHIDVFGGNREMWTVVLLGWLGAEEKHLRRYADIYIARGFRSVQFVVPLREVVGLDFGRKLEEKVARLADELAHWCSDTTRDGKERNLLFHTFSNTGWLVYGALLRNLHSRGDVIAKIKGCVVDSGAASEISSMIWAAGFCAALMKKRNSAVFTSLRSIDEGNPKGSIDRASLKNWKSQFTENISMFILEKLFSLILILPDVNRRLSVVLSILSKEQPPCPQLYLYSSADEVIPASSVESFFQAQKAMGRIVCSYNFGTSPHVDHFRSFPHIYCAKIYEFLEECCFETVYRA
ncbi:hypothetical protein HPP92_004904 [Vanilla planifolia]|uniref:Transmembrane protein 53 n=1 Tax=Vanilla planifolia TaxID=51239 RepID=A0A835RMF9_VANPL|nr:hypothetical protein HPP92_004904 [Vanilla planifolia]